MTESSTENIGVQTEIATTQEVIQRTESNLLDLKGDIDAEDLLTAINSSRDEGNKLTIQTINNLDGEGLSNFIETSFKTNNEWLTYSEMKNNPFFGFMVQAGIKRLSDKLGDKKYDDNGNEVENGNGENKDNNTGKTLSERLEEIGGIDNVYGENTKSLVSLVQKILNINVDGFAGPQFFAKLCSELTNNKIGEFQVKGYDENNYPFNFDNDVDTETSESIGITESTETTNNTVEIQQKSTEYKLSWGENINFTMNCYDGISISNEKQNLKNGIIGYKLNLPDFCELKTTNIYVYMKDGKLSYGNPELNSGISKYLTIKKVNDTTFYLKIKDEIKPKYKSANIDNLDVTYDTSKITVTKNNTDIVAVANIDGNKRKCIVREDENNNWHCYITNQKDGSLSISPDFKAKLTNGKLTISLKDNNDKKEDFKNKVNDVLQKLDTIKGKGDISVAYEDNQNKIHYSIYHPHKQHPTLSNYNDNGKYIGFSLVPHQKKISEFANKLNIRGNDTFYKMTAKAVEYVHNGENSSVMGKIGGGDQMNKWSDRNQTKMYYWCKNKVWVKSDKSNKRPKGTRASDFLKRCTDLNLEQDKTDIGFWLAYKDMNIKSLVLSR